MTTDLPAPRPALTEPVRTDRLVLRPATADDADASFAYRRREEVGRWITEIPTDADAYRAAFIEPGRLASTIVVELDGVIIGDLMLRMDDPWSQTEVAEQARGTQAELGWTLDPAWTGHGYATEAVRALLEISFLDLGLRRVVALCFADNESSWRLMERVGMRRESHTIADALHRSGRWLDGYSYALLADEWRATSPSVGR